MTFTLALAGCNQAPSEPQRSRPDWRGAEIEGIAPLMSPKQVEAALRAGGYTQTRCSSNEQLLENPLYEGERSSCYRSPDRPFRMMLHFLELREGRRLVGAYFSDKRVAFLHPEENVRHSKAFAEELRKRFGPPRDTIQSPDFATHYWDRPGGDPHVRDKISTVVGSTWGANARMETRWAHDEALPSQRVLTGPGDAASRSR